MISAKTVQELISEINQTDETESLEAKRSSEVGRSLLETICSLSNEPGLGGGTILLGLEKEEMSLFPNFLVNGIDGIDKIITDIGSQVSSVFNVPVRVDISQAVVNGKCVVRVDVPELNPGQKPLYFMSQGLPKGAFRRIGSTDQRCNRDDLFVFFQHSSQEAPDRQVVEEATWDDIDLEAIDAYRNARARLNPLAEELNWSNVDLLYSLNCIKKGKERIEITKAGLVTFGKAAALRRLDPTNRVDYIRLSGKEWVPDPEKRFDSIEIRGPALKIIGRVISAILDDIPKAFGIQDGNAQRTDTPLIPERVIREAVVNAVAHRSYRSFTPIQVLRYSNRIEIRNPGYSLKSQERFDEPGSAQRNPHIAEVLHETRFAETKGSGIRVMRQKMTEMGLSEPTFMSSREDDKFSTILLFHHFLSEKDWAWLAAFQEFGLDNEQMRALIFMREMGAIDNASYRHLNQVDTLAASVSLRRLKDHGLVEPQGSGSRTHYVPTPAFNEIGSGAKVHGSPLSMHAKGASMPLIDSPAADVLPSALSTRIQKLRKRLDPEDAERLIRELCQHKPMSADEIATLLGRQKHYIANKYLFRMVREGALAHTIPEMVKHPNQRYQSVTKENSK